MQEIDVPNLIQDSFSRISLRQQYCDRKKKKRGLNAMLFSFTLNTRIKFITAILFVIFDGTNVVERWIDACN